MEKIAFSYCTPRAVAQIRQAASSINLQGLLYLSFRKALWTVTVRE